MPGPINNELFAKALFALLQETFEKVEGVYLDRGTSLFETIDSLTYQQASHALVDGGSTIAGHVYHIRFYLQVIRDYMRGQWAENLDWKQSWVVKRVDNKEWVALRQKLREEYAGLTEYLKEFTDWSEERRLGGSMAIIAHTAFHIGAIRQLVLAAKE